MAFYNRDKASDVIFASEGRRSGPISMNLRLGRTNRAVD